MLNDVAHPECKSYLDQPGLPKCTERDERLRGDSQKLPAGSDGVSKGPDIVA